MPLLNEIQSILSIVRDNFQPGSLDIQRVFHGRGHCYPDLEFLTIDYFSRIVFIVMYKDVSNEWTQLLSRRLVEFFYAADQTCIKSIYLQRRFPGRTHPSKITHECLYGDTVAQARVQENGLQYQVSLSANQNIGFFIDMSEGRQWLGNQAQGKHILNLFAYTCSLSVVAMASGALSVTNLDMSKNALKTGQINHRLNGTGQHNVRFLAHDIFKSWSILRKSAPYDLIIIDPPSFQAGSFEACRDYQKIIRRLPQWAAAKATIMVCVNAPNLGAAFLKELFQDHLPDYRFQYQLKQPVQFPECSVHAGLKILIYEAP